MGGGAPRSAGAAGEAGGGASTGGRKAAGALYVVATPIGNLADLTFRAVEVLRGCPVVAAEDTRRLRILAERYGFRPRRVVRCDERAEESAAAELLEVLRAGEDVALTSDAGTPGISDPGYRLVRQARAEGIRVVPVPGPSAPIAALSASGLPTDRFVFAGFPPRRPARLRAFLEPLLARPETVVLLESPERVLKLLDEVAALVPVRPVVVARELTKVHEELVGGTAVQVRERLAPRSGRMRGELVVLVAGSGLVQERRAPEAGAPPVASRRGAGCMGTGGAERAAREILRRPWARKLTHRDLADLLAVACGLDRNDAYRLVHIAPVAAQADERRRGR